MTILITGGTGFIASRLIDDLLDKGHKIVILTHERANNNAKIKAIQTLNDIDSHEKFEAIINLAGASINKRWTKKYKETLISSRINTTKNIIHLIKRLKHTPSLLISASAIGYYGAQNDKILDEGAMPIDGFTHQLCEKWETEALKAEKLNMRVCIARFGVVLGKNGGALKDMLPAFKMGLAGKIGTGNQYFSWVHIDDVVAALYFLMQNTELKGAYNITAPTPVTNGEFTKSLGQVVKRSTFFTMPAFIVKILFGEMGQSLLLTGQRVVPKKLEQAGFRFTYSKIEATLKNILHPRPLD